MVLSLAIMLGACSGGGGSDDAAAGPGGELSLSPARPGDLARAVQGTLRERESQRQTGAPVLVVEVAPTPAAVPSSTATAEARSGPLAQEQGVDEADVLQTDGRHLYALLPGAGGGWRLQVHERGSDGHAHALASLALPSDGDIDITRGGMHLGSDGSALAVVTQSWIAAQPCADCAATPQALPVLQRVAVQRVEVGAPAAPAAGQRISIEGALVDSRRIGDTLVLVTVLHPRFTVDQLPAGSGAPQREAAIAGVSAADVLPRLRRNGGAAQPLLSEADCWVQPGNASLEVATTTITLIDLRAAALEPRSRCFVGGTEALYMTPASLYLATTRYAYAPTALGWSYPADIRTDLHKFALVADGIAYRGSGQVDGHLGWDGEKKPYRLSEHGGDLRVLSYTGRAGWFGPAGAVSVDQPPSPARLTLLRERAGQPGLQALATLPNDRRPQALGKPGEQVYAVRFAGARAYLVTFRRTDPLYVLDLADPADPRIAGALELAGYSESLFPLDGGLLFGVGRQADADGRVTGLQVALFDVADAAAPRTLGTIAIGGVGSGSALDGSRHGLNLLMKDGVARIALPVTLAPALPDPSGANWQRGLQRFEVDTLRRTLATRPMLGAASGWDAVDMTLARSLQTGDQVHYLAGGTVTSWDW